MSLQYTLTPEAQAEYDEAFDYYDAIRADLSAEFEAQAAEAFHRIATHPRIGTELLPDIRRVMMRKLPYAVIYRERNGTLEVIAVFHTSRDPQTWRGRL